MHWNPDLVRTTCDSPLGPVVLAASRRGLAGLWFDGQRHQPDPQRWPVNDAHPVLRRATQEIGDYFAGRRRRFELPLDLGSGTPFQQAVWRALLDIPFGASARYGELAARVGRPTAVRAVGAAVGQNPVSIIVPCHRVIGADGTLTGYAGGLERKAELLRLEGSLIA